MDWVGLNRKCYSIGFFQWWKHGCKASCIKAISGKRTSTISVVLRDVFGCVLSLPRANWYSWYSLESWDECIYSIIPETPAQSLGNVQWMGACSCHCERPIPFWDICVWIFNKCSLLIMVDDFGGKNGNSLEIMPPLETGKHFIFLGCNSKTGLFTRKLKVVSRKRKELSTFYTWKERCRNRKDACWPHLSLVCNSLVAKYPGSHSLSFLHDTG